MTMAVALVVVAVAMAVARDGVSNESRTDDLPGHISWSTVRRRSVQFIAAPDVMSGCLVVLSAAGDQHTMTAPVGCNIMGGMGPGYGMPVDAGITATRHGEVLAQRPAVSPPFSPTDFSPRFPTIFLPPFSQGPSLYKLPCI